MATHTGSAGVVKVGSDQVAEVRSWTLDQTQDVVEDTELGDTVKTYKATLNSSTGTVECYWDETDTNGQEALTIGATATLNLYPEGATTGDKYYTGSAIVTSVGIAQAHDGIVERSIGVQFSGAVTLTTV